MKLRSIESTSFVPLPRERVFAFFADPENLPRIMPRSMRLTNLSRSTRDVREGTELVHAFRVFGLWMRWTTRFEVWDPPRRFVDVQVRGPFRRWRHCHAFEEVPGGTELRDRVEYAVRGGALADTLVGPAVRRNLRRVFVHRARATEELLVREVDQRAPDGPSG